MNKCNRCGVQVMDDSAVCPLCNMVLQEQEEMPEMRTDPYPDIAWKTRKLRRLFRIGMFAALLIEIILVVVNYYTYEGTWWSIITGGAFLYLFITLREILTRRSGHIRKIYLQVAGALALLVCIDLTLGYRGWSLEYGLPCLIYGLNGTIIVCMIVNFANWQNYLIMQLFTVLLSILDLVFYFTGMVEGMILPWIALGVSVLLWTGTLVLGDRKAANELKRKFHV